MFPFLLFSGNVPILHNILHFEVLYVSRWAWSKQTAQACYHQ